MSDTFTLTDRDFTSVSSKSRFTLTEIAKLSRNVDASCIVTARIHVTSSSVSCILFPSVLASISDVFRWAMTPSINTLSVIVTQRQPPETDFRVDRNVAIHSSKSFMAGFLTVRSDKSERAHTDRLTFLGVNASSVVLAGDVLAKILVGFAVLSGEAGEAVTSVGAVQIDACSIVVAWFGEALIYISGAELSFVAIVAFTPKCLPFLRWSLNINALSVIADTWHSMARETLTELSSAAEWAVAVVAIPVVDAAGAVLALVIEAMIHSLAAVSSVKAVVANALITVI